MEAFNFLQSASPLQVCVGDGEAQGRHVGIILPT